MPEARERVQDRPVTALWQARFQVASFVTWPTMHDWGPLASVAQVRSDTNAVMLSLSPLGVLPSDGHLAA